MLLIKNAKIIDGTGAPERHGDVLVSGKSISAIGNFPNKKAETVIEGLGARLVPGFVNVRMETAHAIDILTDPAQRTARDKGFTTQISGGDGIALAPLLYGSLEPFRKWGCVEPTNINWHTLLEFKKTVNRLPLGTNFGTFAGYNAIRRDIMQSHAGDPTDKELTIILSLLEQAMEEGAQGIAINLATAHGRKISHEEVRRAARLAAKTGRPLALRLRAQTEHFMEAAQEALALYQSTGARMLITDFLPNALVKAQEKDFLLAYELLKNAGDGLCMEIRLEESRLIPLYELLPRFAQEGTIETMTTLINNKNQRKKILTGLPRLEGARIARMPREHARLTGVTLEAFAHDRKITSKEALLELMHITRLRAAITIPQELTPLHAELIKDGRMLVTGSPQSVFAIADRARLPLETAIMKLTALPAAFLNLKKRGVIAENCAADLALMDDHNEITRTIVNGADKGIFV